MSKKEIVRRYCLFLAGLLCNAFGVAFVTRATLGASPIAAIPFSLSLILPRVSMGSWVAVYNVLLVGLQWLLLRKNADRVQLLLQVVIAFVFGYFVDLSLLCLGAFFPALYPVKILSLVLGCAIIAFGAWLEVIADVVMLPADGFVRAVARVLGRPYASIRVVSDVSMTLIAAALCLLFLGRLEGVREGTVIAAVITGNIVKIFVKTLQPMKKKLLPQ